MPIPNFRRAASSTCTAVSGSTPPEVAPSGDLVAIKERLRELKDLQQESLLQYLRCASALALQSQDVTDGREPWWRWRWRDYHLTTPRRDVWDDELQASVTHFFWRVQTLNHQRRCCCFRWLIVVSRVSSTSSTSHTTKSAATTWAMASWISHGQSMPCSSVPCSTENAWMKRWEWPVGCWKLSQVNSYGISSDLQLVDFPSKSEEKVTRIADFTVFQ